MVDLDELRKLAEAATPGPWLIDSVREEHDAGSYSVHGIKDVAPTRWYSDSDMAHTALDALDYSDAEYIAAANPQAVLALIERVRQAESELRDAFKTDIPSLRDERDAALARITDLRQSLRSESLAHRVDATLLHEYERRFAEAAKLHQCFDAPSGFRWCSGCSTDEYPEEWPCPTAVALGLNEGEN